MNAEKFSEAMSEIDSRYIEEAIRYKRKASKPSLTRWGAIAAGVCLLCMGGFTLSYVIQKPARPAVPQDNMPPAPQVTKPPAQEQAFVPISSLLAEVPSGIEEMAAETALVPIGQYTGVYRKAASADSDILSQSTGQAVIGANTWYLVSGHTDLQYLIQNDNGVYSLWEFISFDSEEYPYRDVLELIYQIDGADKITEIQVNPADMDNTPAGRAMQAEIGTQTVTDHKDIEIIYQVLSSLVCYGDNRWDIIDYGNAEAAADTDTPSSEAVRLGRYLTLVTSWGNEINGLKYTAVSNMFYEFSGIAYKPLGEEEAARVCEILRIDDLPEPEKIQTGERDSAQPLEPEEATAAPGTEAPNTTITLEYITELQAKISNAMSNQELPFVTSTAVYENPYRLHIVVTSRAEDDMAKLRAFDTIGGALEIEYSEAPVTKS